MSLPQKRFNIRVYALVVRNDGFILLSTENRKGFSFTKFPGGGVEWGEGISDALKRECKEELGVQIDIESHFYTTDFFQPSAFNENDQLISIYYKVDSSSFEQIKHGQSALDVEKGNKHQLFWHDLKSLKNETLTFPIDQKVLQKLKRLF